MKCKWKHREIPLHTRITQIKKTNHNKLWWGCGVTATLTHWWWECKMVPSLWGKACQFLKNLNIHLPNNPTTSFTGIYPKEMETYVHENIGIFKAVNLFIITKNWKEPKIYIW